MEPLKEKPLRKLAKGQGRGLLMAFNTRGLLLGLLRNG